MPKWANKRIDLPVAEFDLDEDGWIDFRPWLSGRDYATLQRLTAKAIREAIAAGGKREDAEVDILSLWPALVTGWHVVMDGEPVQFDPDNPEAFYDLPIGIVEKFLKVVAAEPGLIAGLGGETPAPKRTRKGRK